MQQGISGRDVRNIGTAMRDAGKDISESIAKSSAKDSRPMRQLIGNIQSISAVQAAEMLSDEEVDELEKLIDMGDAARDYGQSRMQDGRWERRYRILGELGFVKLFDVAGGGTIFVGATPRASWAVERRKQRREEADDRSRKERRDRTMNLLVQLLFVLLGWLLGFVSAVVAPLLVGMLS